MSKRTAKIERNTKETKIKASIDLDGDGSFKGETKVPFFDHMLTLFARHGALSLQVKCDGDVDIECHHTVEDVGIVIGQLIAEAIGDKKGIKRYGHAVVPMEEALCESTVDFCGRSFLYFDAEFNRSMIENYATEITEDFFRAVCNNAGLTLHLECRRGRNAHHIVEGLFKSFAQSVRMALSPDGKFTDVPSTKGHLD